MSTGRAAAVPLRPESPFCQRWDNGRHSWRHVSEGGFDRHLFDVSPIHEAAARAVVERHHYARTLPAVRMSWGLFTTDEHLVDETTIFVDGRALVGVLCLSVPMSTAVLTNVFPTLDPFMQSLELGRLVLTDPVPANAESWFLTRAWRQAADLGIRGVVSFADPLPRRRVTAAVDEHGIPVDQVEILSPGHVGACYQGAGAIACGRSTARTLLYLPRQGEVLSERTVSKIRLQHSGSDSAERRIVELGATPRHRGEDPRTWLRQALDDIGAIRVRHPGNYRYAWPVGDRRTRHTVTIGLPATSYPKAATGLLPAPAS